MNEFAKRIFDLNELEQFARRKGFINDLHPSVKIGITLLYIIAVAYGGKYELSRVLVLAVYPVLLLSITDVPYKSFFSKLIIPSFLAIGLGLPNMFYDRDVMISIGSIAISGGVVSFITLFIKALLTISATLLLASTTTISELGHGMKILRVPERLVMLLLLMYRYIGVLLSETQRTIEAHQLRSGDSKGIHISSWGSLVGQIMIRSYRRSEEIYNAMRLRGYGTGENI